MSITRRHFLLGTAGASAGLILPSYYQKALEFIDRTGKPMLEAVQRPRIELTAVQGDWGEYTWALGVGKPCSGPPPMTLGQFAENYNEHEAIYEGVEEGEEPDWDQPIDWGDEYYSETWYQRDAPCRRAYNALRGIDLGPQLSGPESVGEVRLEHGHTMVSEYFEVGAVDEISLSLLQQRLNDLGAGISITVAR